MSIRMTLKAFDLKDDSLSDGAWRVLVKLCDLSNDSGFCIVGYDHLAETCGGKSVKSIQRHVRTLIELGYLKRSYRYKNNRQVSNQYQVNIPAQIRGDKTEPASEIGGDNIEPAGATDLSHRSCLKDPVKDTPIVPNGDEADRIKNTENPEHKDYKLTFNDSLALMKHWNDIAGSRFKHKRHINESIQRNLTKSYAIYKKRFTTSELGGQLKTKMEFAESLINAFDSWVKASPQPDFYYLGASVNGSQWSASLEYATRPATYEKIINNEY